MAAARMQEPGRSFAVPEQDQVLAQHSHALGPEHRVGYADRMPVTAQKFAPGVPAPTRVS